MPVRSRKIFFPQLFSGAQKSFTTLGSKLILGITNLILYVVISAFILFYLINDSDKVIGSLHAYLPLRSENIDKLLSDMAGDTRSLVLGQLIIALMQGTLAALGLFCCRSEWSDPLGSGDERAVVYTVPGIFYNLVAGLDILACPWRLYQRYRLADLGSGCGEFLGQPCPPKADPARLAESIR